jgi:hypothetical protein
MTNVNDNVRISDNIGVVASSSSKQLSSIRTLSLPFFILNILLELSVAMRNLWCLEKNSILPFIISATGIVPQSLFKNLKILDLENTLVVEIQKGILLYSCHIVRKFLNIDTEHKTQKSQNAEARRR